jgi:predicted alpha/beta superfamily hydrolase
MLSASPRRAVTTAFVVLFACAGITAGSGCGSTHHQAPGTDAGGVESGTPPGDGAPASDAHAGHDAATDAAPGDAGGSEASAPGSDAGTDAAAPGDAAAPAVDAAPDTGGSPDAGAATLLRVHYPAGGHTMTIRGSAPGLSWTASQTATASGNTFSYALSGLAATAEWKPLLDDTTWARGPNYHVSPGQTVDVWPHFTSTAGQVTTLIASFHSTTLGNDRPIYAYLPASYAENTEATFPVVYMHDGQNLWAAHPELAFSTPWNVDSAFDAAAETGTCSAGGVVGWGAQPLGGTAVTCNGDADCASGACRTFPEGIVIGVANIGTTRIYEYTPTTDPDNPGGGGADLYLQMLVQELKPTIDGMLRTRPGAASTAMAGSSLGGLVTAYAGRTHPDVYGLVAELSPSTWWNNDVIVGDIQSTPAAPARPLVVYVDSGAGSADDESDTDLLAAAYLALGYADGTSYRHVVQAGGQHSETYWAQRFPGAMQLLLGTR